MDGEAKRVMQAKAMLEVFPGSNSDQPQTALWNEPSSSYATWGTPWAPQRGWLFLSPISQCNKENECSNIREINYLTVVISKKDFTFSFISEYFLKKKKKTQILTYVRQRGTAALHLHRCQALSRPLPLPESALLSHYPSLVFNVLVEQFLMLFTKLFP